MRSEDLPVPTIVIGVDPKDGVATLTPSAQVATAGSRVEFRMEAGLDGRAELTFPVENGLRVVVLPGQGTQVQVSRTGAYYLVLERPNLAKIGAMAVIIIDP